MKVILKQSGRGWIDLCIEFRDVCITIHTSSSFDPYERLYIWLGKIRDSQLPEKMVIDEEGYGVELIVEETKNDVVVLRVEPWFRKEGWRVISATEIKEPWKVYEKAEEMADRYHQNVLSKIDEGD